MDKSHQQAQETRKRNQEARAAMRARNEAEAMKNITVLKQVRDSPDSPLESRMEAVKMLADYERRGYSYLL